MITPINFITYQTNFWEETPSSTKGIIFTYVAVSAVGLRLFSSLNDRAFLSIMPRNFTIYETIGTLSLLIYLIGSTFAGFLYTPKK